MPWSQLFFSLQGRATRQDFWLRFLLPLAILYALLMIVLPMDAFDYAVSEQVVRQSPYASVTPLNWGLLIASDFLAIVVSGKRCHDRGRSAWFLLVFLVPVVGSLWLLVELGFLRGTVGPNRFGPDPLQTGLPNGDGVVG